LTTPYFRILFYDEYGNGVENQPEEVIDAQVWLGIYNYTTTTVVPELVMCKDAPNAAS